MHHHAEIIIIASRLGITMIEYQRNNDNHLRRQNQSLSGEEAGSVRSMHIVMLLQLMKIHPCGNLQSIAANRARGKKMNRHNSIIDIGNVVITNKFHSKIIIPNPAATTTISGGEERAAPLLPSAIHNLFSLLLSVW